MIATIIGCNGYIGKHLSLFLLAKKWSIFGYDLKECPFMSMTYYSPLDLVQKNQVNEINTQVDYIFYFSGITGTSRGYDEYEQYIDINEKGLVHILDRMRDTKSKARIIFPSTRLVYKGIKDVTLHENSDKEFKTIYALNKWFGEQVIQQYNDYFGIQYNIFRIGVPYGNLFDDVYSYGTIGSFLKKAREKKNIILFGSGEQKRTFTHVEDICLQIYNAILHTSSKDHIYNIDGETFSLKEIAKKIATKYHVDIEYKGWITMDEKIESGDTVFDAASIRKIITNPLKNTFERWLSEKKC